MGVGGRRSLVREEQPRAVGRRRTEGAGGGRRVQERERNKRRQQALVAVREREEELVAASAVCGRERKTNWPRNAREAARGCGRWSEGTTVECWAFKRAFFSLS